MSTCSRWRAAPTRRLGRSDARTCATPVASKRAEETGGNHTGAGGDYFFDGYLRDPVNLLALRHNIAEMVEALVKM